MTMNHSLINLKTSFSKIHELQNLIKLQRTQSHSCMYTYPYIFITPL